MAWSLIEVRRYADALQMLEKLRLRTEHPIRKRNGSCRSALAAQQHDQAMVDFNGAVAGQPEWENSNWVHALYSPLVAQSIQDMQAERERRKRK